MFYCITNNTQISVAYDRKHEFFLLVGLLGEPHFRLQVGFLSALVVSDSGARRHMGMLFSWWVAGVNEGQVDTWDAS